MNEETICVTVIVCSSPEQHGIVKTQEDSTEKNVFRSECWKFNLTYGISSDGDAEH